ncbi:hypothetical protein [Hymenobacter sp. YC55]|uniref:hypothetical protein n=1 Tax=Hymenobacter sp. YC55 TaxID=3034019 RepID=UPI0023F7DC6E|nr:hypothetical protein [Hymenobacter sp. YC55]MDF7811799.1 hypothetical protein [Hymenobacter sp. YC55]
MTTADYGASLQFDYVTTFSLLRGVKWERAQVAIRKEIAESRKLLLTAKAKQLLEIRQRLALLQQKNNLDHARLTEGKEAYHITATPIATLQRQTPEVDKLLTILKVPFESRSYWMCGPTFRDALAFYNEKHQLVAVLNVCFGCEQMQNESGVEIQADTTVYPALHQWFSALGHKIDDNY